jgi:hypothetical protein
MSVDPVEWKIQTLRGQLLELGSAIRQLNQSGLDRAFSSEVETGSRKENASNQESRAPFRFNRSGALGIAPRKAHPGFALRGLQVPGCLRRRRNDTMTQAPLRNCGAQ